MRSESGLEQALDDVRSRLDALASRLEAFAGDLASLDERFGKLHNLKVQVYAFFAALTAVLAATGWNLYGFFNEQIKQQVPQIVQAMVAKAAQQAIDAEIPRRVVPQIKQEVQQQFDEQKPELNRLIDSRVAGAIPPAMKLGWMVERLGGNFTVGPGQRIERIDLSGTGVTDEDLARLGQQQGIDSVESLVLRNTSVTAGGLAPLAKWPRLEELDLTGSAARKEGARNALPSSVHIRAD